MEKALELLTKLNKAILTQLHMYQVHFTSGTTGYVVRVEVGEADIAEGRFTSADELRDLLISVILKNLPAINK